MDYQLVVIRGRSAANAVKLQDGVTTAGRQDDCQLRIKSSQVSRKHCQLFEKHGMLLVKDLGSSNGTFVNGKKIDGQRVMEPGDELGIGPIVFRIEKVGQPAPVQPGGKPHDTAVIEAVPVATALPADDDFEIDFDEVPEAVVDEDMSFEIELDDALSSPAAEVKPAGSPSLATSTKPAPPKKAEPAPPPPTEDAGVADEAIADFLTGIKLDDD